MRTDGYVQMSSYTCFVLECGVQIMEFPTPSQFIGDTCILSYINAGQGLVAVMDLGGVTVHSFSQFTQNMMRTFGVTVTPVRSSQHQVFAYMGDKLTFIPISTTDSLITRRGTYTDLALNKIDEIVARENIILQQLQALKQFAESDPNHRTKRSLASWILSPDIGISII